MHDVQRHHERPTRYVAPASLDEAIALLAEHGPAARVVAGGTDLLLEIARGARVGVDLLVDLTRIEGLDTIELEQHDPRDGAQDVVHLGPLVTHNQAVSSPDIVRHALPLAQACLEVGAPALRNRATVVGNLVTASPANDTISALWALNAVLVLRSAVGTRRVKLRDFYTGIRRTVLEPGELVVRIEVPALGDARGIFVKLGQRRAQAISVVHLAAVVHLVDGVVTAASLALGSVGPMVVSAARAERSLVGKPLEAAAIEQAAQLASASVVPITDVRASAAYRTDEVAVMVRRALGALAGGAQRSCWPARPVLLSATGTAHASGTAHAPGPAESSGTAEPSGTIDGIVDDAAVVQCTVNGREVRADGAVQANLLDWLRDQAGLTGSKEGCAEGECGACTVVLDGAAVLSCLVPAARAHGTTVTTIEGLADGAALHPMQQAFVDQFAVQCGYCIPGFVMAADRLLAECPNPSRDDIAAGLSGNLCRCTGYYRFYEAVEQASRHEGPTT